MKLQILGDLHTEFSIPSLEFPSVDAVILAGDIGTGMKAISWVKETYVDRKVILVLGNHEFYGQVAPDFSLVADQFCKDSNLQLLENSSVVIGDCEIFGCTLWTDFDLFNNQAIAMATAKEIMNDFLVIKSNQGRRKFTPTDSVKFHYKSKTWLFKAIETSKAKKKIVLTHHAPSIRSILPQYQTDILSSAFCSDLEKEIIIAQPDLWVHGHTHYCCDYMIGQTRVVSNQRGYKDGELPGFCPNLVFEL